MTPLKYPSTPAPAMGPGMTTDNVSLPDGSLRIHNDCHRATSNVRLDP